MINKVKSLLENRNYQPLKDIILTLNTVNLSEILEYLDSENALIFFRLLPKDIAVDVFSYLSVDQQEKLISLITDKEIKHIIKDLYLDDMINLIEEMPSNLVNKVLKNTKEADRILINQFLNYPENSAGSLMTIEYVRLKKNMHVYEALNYIKKIGFNKETIYTCYITDESRKLEGIVSLKNLVLEDENLFLKDIMETDVVYINTYESQQEAIIKFKKYDFIALPVVDKEMRLTGIITVDDIVDAIEQENTEDFQKMAAIEPSEDPYLESNTLYLAKHRILWLLILMISATFTGRIIQRFEDVLQSVVILTAFIPMLMDTGGNAGAQSSTLIIRGLALGDIKVDDAFKVLLKEFKVSIFVGIGLCFINFLRIYYLEKIPLDVSVTVTITLFLTIVIAKLVGGILPIIASKLKLDPAIMASPLITTIVDALALMIYFLLAVSILKLQV